MNATELLEAIATHFERGGTQLNPTIALIIAAREVLNATPGDAMRPLASKRLGLTDAEKTRRRRTLGSSEVAAVLRVNPYQTDHAIWMSKVMGEDFQGNEATELGTLAEPLIFQIYSDRYGKTLAKGEYTLGPEPWMSCTPDATIVGEDGLVEAKLVGLRSIWQWGNGNSDDEESDAVPLHYLSQAMWQLAVTGRAFVHVSALLGTEFRTYTIRRNEGLIQAMTQTCRDWWQRYVVAAQPPPVDGSESARAMIHRLYPRSNDEVVEATPEMEAIAAQLLAARADAESAAAKEDALENEMKALLKDARGARGNGWRVRFSSTKSGTRPFFIDPVKDKRVA